MKADTIRKMTPITHFCGGRERIINYDMNSFIELENKYGSVQEAMDALQTNKLVHVRNVLWAGLIHEEITGIDADGEPTGYNMSPFTVGSWILPNEMATVADKLSKAFEGSMREAEPEKAALSVVKSKAKPEVLPGGVKIATVVETPEEVKNV